jgi:TatD DNase family protein
MKKKAEAPNIDGYVDTHFHILHSIKMGLSHEEILDAAFNSGMSFGIDIATGPEDFDERLTFAADYPGLFLSVGYYPSWAESIPDFLEETLVAQTRKNDKVVAIGESGLDYHWNYGTPEDQQELFSRQINVANQLKLPLIVHCRDAQEDLLKVLRHNRAEYRGVIHCFSGDYSFASACVDLGFYISFAGNLTYKNAPELREVLKRIPLQSILMETDAPYLSPEPRRGRTNMPSNVRFTYHAAANLLNIPVQDLTSMVRSNMEELFSLPQS